MSSKKSSKPDMGVIATNNKTKSLSDMVAEDIKRVADKLGISPCYMTRSGYINNGGQYMSYSHAGNDVLSKVGGLRAVLNAYFPKPIMPGSVIRLQSINSTQREIIKTQGSRDIFEQELSNIVDKFPAIKVKSYKAKRKNSKIDRALCIVISDLHIGSDLDIEETGHAYGIAEEARVVGHTTKTVCEYKLDYRDKTELHVFMLGDVIQNMLHGISSADLLHLQTCRAIWLLTQMIARFSENFKKVYIHCAVGNHGRDTAIHPSRAIHLKYNAVETTIYYAIHNSVRHLKNVAWDQPKTPWVDVTVLGHRIYGTHGDTNFSIGNPGSSLNVRKIENTINKINASLPGTTEYEVFIVGHAHTGMVSKLSNGSFLIVNGPGTPPDPFAESIDILEGPQDQIMFEATAEYAVGDLRFIDMTGSDKNKELDKIIEPWKGLGR